MIISESVKSFASFDEAYKYAKSHNIDIEDIQDSGSSYIIEIDDSYKKSSNGFKFNKSKSKSYQWYGSCDVIFKDDYHTRFETTVRATTESKAKNIVKHLVNKKYGYKVKIVNLSVIRKKK